MGVDDKKKYNYMENALQTINKEHISLPKWEVRRNNKILEKIVDGLIANMKRSDILFQHMFSRVFYGGSYYDGVRFGHPDEFDLDLLLALPEFVKPIIRTSNISGFVNVQLIPLSRFLKQPEDYKLFYKMKKLVDRKGYLITSRVSSWMESVFTKALNTYKVKQLRISHGRVKSILLNNGSTRTLKLRGTINFSKVSIDIEFTPHSKFLKKQYPLPPEDECSAGQMGILYKHGPAFTLKLKGTINSTEFSMDIDLVPGFVFPNDMWPPAPYRPCPTGDETEFFIVPKIPKTSDNVPKRYWRLSFQEQERYIMWNLGFMKPAIKLLKLLRDNESWFIIASYYIKMVFLWEIDKNRRLFTANYSLSYVFMMMLKRFHDFVRNKNIPYFWNYKNNLLLKDPVPYENISNRLEKIINNIENNLGNSAIVRQYLG